VAGSDKNIGKHVEECYSYQKMKNKIETSVGKLMVNEILEKLWMYLMVDFIIKLPLVARKDVILVIYDKLLKMAHFVAKTKETLVEVLARLFRDNVWKIHRLQKSIVSDKGPQFVFELTKKLNSILEIEMRFLTAFYS